MPAPSRKRKYGVEEITFDWESRREYLTGFHKRKLQRTKHAQEEAEKRAKAEKLEERRKIRETRKKEVEAHIKAVETASRKAAAIENGELVASDNDDEEENEWEGIEEGQDIELGKINEEAQYIDEDKFTTVTVETMDLEKDDDESEDGAVKEEKRRKAEERENEGGKKKRKSKEKKKKFRYLTKSERRTDRAKIKASKAKQRRGRKV